MAELDEALIELADAYNIATEYWDWQGRHVAVAAETIVSVLAALAVDASTPEAAWHALAEHHREALDPDAAAVPGHPGGADGLGARCTYPRRPGRGLGRSGDRRAPRTACASWRTGTRRARSTAAGSARPPSRFPATCRSATTRCGPDSGEDGDDAADRHPGVAGPAGADGRASRLGAGHPALQRPVAAVLGRRATWSTWRTSLSGPPTSTAPTSC